MAKSQIVGYGTEDPKQLQTHPLNFRVHPEQQNDVVHHSLEELGWLDELLVNVRSGKEWPEEERNVKTVINGHLRRQIAIDTNEEEVPVRYVDLSPEQERLALALFDESTMLAQRDADTLSALLESINSEDDIISTFLSELADEVSLYPDFEEMEDMTSLPKEVYQNGVVLSVNIENVDAYQDVSDAIANLLLENPDWEATLASQT